MKIRGKQSKTACHVIFLRTKYAEGVKKCTSVSVLPAWKSPYDTLGNVERKMRISSAKNAPKFLKKITKKC